MYCRNCQGAELNGTTAAKMLMVLGVNCHVLKQRWLIVVLEGHPSNHEWVGQGDLENKYEVGLT